MEPAKPIGSITPTDSCDLKNINFKEKIIIKQDNKQYEIQYGINNLDNGNVLCIKVSLNNYYYFLSKYTLSELKSISLIFSMYNNVNEIIDCLKKLNLRVSEENDDLLLKYDIFVLNCSKKNLELILKKKLYDSNNINKNLLEENTLLKKQISKNATEINLLKEENKKLRNEIAELKKMNQKNKIYYTNYPIDSKILNSFEDMDFIIKYIRNNDNSFHFNNINLLYRGTKDGDRTETCHRLCDNKTNVIIIIKSDNGYIFGGFCKIGFKTKTNREYKIDNNCFLFSINLKEIYPVIENKEVICYTSKKRGLCFYSSLVFNDNFLNNNESLVCEDNCYNYFKNLPPNIGINGGKKYFKCLDLEVFQLI